jgi:hypothetical protein|tara:strand:- start:1381 stop:1884 length:504 start_codon:yes stop_codon:yes gene_type:complete
MKLDINEFDLTGVANTVIFDLDGTLADIEERRSLATKENGKMNWDIFFDPKNIALDKPNHPVILMAKILKGAGHNIVIFSGRSKATKETTKEWLAKHDVPFDVIKMRPTGHPFAFMPDDKLKQHWLDSLFEGDRKNDIVCVFDDRDKVVKMWRENGLDCFQVANGNF